MNIENAKIEIDGDDIWINGDLISRSELNGVWVVYTDNDIKKEFNTLEEAAKYCLEQSHD